MTRKKKAKQISRLFTFVCRSKGRNKQNRKKERKHIRYQYENDGVYCFLSSAKPCPSAKLIRLGRRFAAWPDKNSDDTPDIEIRDGIPFKQAMNEINPDTKQVYVPKKHQKKYIDGIEAFFNIDGTVKAFTLPYGAYIGARPIVKNTTDFIVKNSIKRHTNWIFANNIKNIDKKSEGYVICLDGSQSNTSRALAKNGFPADRIVVPNPFIPISSKNRYKKPINTYVNGSFFECIRDSEALFYRKCSGVGYDACCTWNGNAGGVRPRTDLALAFEKRIFADKSVLWCTFSCRSIGEEQTNSNVTMFVEKQAKLCGYTVNTDGGNKYISESSKSCMMYFMFKISRAHK